MVAVRVLPKLDDLYVKAQKLKTYRDRLAYYRHHNELSGEREKLVVGRTLEFCGGRTVDAVEYHQKKIAKLSEKIRSEKDMRVSFNSGTAFVTFASRLQVSRCIDKNDFYDMAMAKLTVQDRTTWKVVQWKIKQAPSQGEILWENQYKDERKSKMKSYLLLALLLFVCIVLVTPMLLVQKLTPIIKALQD